MSRESVRYPASGGLATPISGHVFRVERRRGPDWYAKYRLPDGRQRQKQIGRRGRRAVDPGPATSLSERRQAWLDDLLASARRGELPGMVRTGATFADASAEWLRWAEHERACKPTTLTDYRYTVATGRAPSASCGSRT